MMKLLSLTCVQTSAYCTTFKMQSWLSAEHVGILIINPWLTGEGLLSHTENLDIFQSHLDCRGYSCHQRLLTWHQLYDAVNGVMVHPSNGEAWKHFNSVHP